VAGDAGAHGRFDTEARSASVQHWLDRHRTGLGLAFLGVLGAIAVHRLKDGAGPRRSIWKAGR
jgi:hypothetical protein